MHRARGERVDDFFARLIKEAKMARHTTRQACINLVTQLPRELKTPLRRWITEKGEELTEEEGKSFYSRGT